YRGNGLGPEAIRAFANWYGSAHGLSRLRVFISPENPHSLHVFSKLGALPQTAPQPPQPEDAPARPSREPLGFILPLPL
ncbi:MAG: GNAT family N-acetyltransferase, partial [Oscillospiraceae bacterium]|nr:GNAT family N-acetyltransferase [Oscillospiraceae bacterium]